jgi:hypothetical protein
MEHTQKETLILHTWLSHKSPSVGEDGDSPEFHTHQRPSYLKREMMMLALPCYRKNIYYEKREDDKKEES